MNYCKWTLGIFPLNIPSSLSSPYHSLEKVTCKLYIASQVKEISSTNSEKIRQTTPASALSHAELCAYAEMEGWMWKGSLGNLALRACLNSSSISKPRYEFQGCLEFSKFSILPPSYDPSFYSAAYEESLHGQPFSCHSSCRLEEVCSLPPLLWQHGRDRAGR